MGFFLLGIFAWSLLQFGDNVVVHLIGIEDGDAWCCEADFGCDVCQFGELGDG